MEKKQEKQAPKKPPQRRKFIITVDAIAPIQVEFEVFATDAEEAYKALNKPNTLSIRQRPIIQLPRMKRNKVSIKDGTTSEIKLVRNS